MSGMELKDFLLSAANVKPSKRQLAWYEMGFYAFVHFTVNTYTGLEWGMGDEDPSIFNPTDLDCDEWVSAIKSAGMKGLILTAKHHDGFCLWPSKYTEHSVKNCPYKNGNGDIVRETAEACRRGGIAFGVYLSPWDRNSKLYGTSEYNDYYCNQLTELLTEYGDVFMVWQDNACGEGQNGKKQEYDFERYNNLVRQYQPDAVIFNDHGPDVRWCGNESGSSRMAEWAVVPSELCYHAEPQTKGVFLEGTLEGIFSQDKNLGALSNILYSKGLVFCGSEVDMSIRDGWFYHEEEKPHSLERLFDTYIRTIGGNACLNLNIPPMPSGRFHPDDIVRLKELGELINQNFSKPVSCEWKKIKEHPSGQCTYEVKLAKKSDINFVVIAEDISKGQRVESFKIRNMDIYHEQPFSIYDGFTIGNKKICQINHNIKTFHVVITSARDEVFLKNISAYTL